MGDIGVHPDIAGFQDLAHAFDLKASALAARATMEAARERRETRGAHNRSDYPDADPALQVNLVWSPIDGVTREPIPAIPDEIAALMEDVDTTGKLVGNSYLTHERRLPGGRRRSCHSVRLLELDQQCLFSA